MYKSYFGFTEIPFSIAPDPRYLYLSEQHKDALAHLLYGVGEHGGFVLLTGEVGTGKTTICRCLLQQMPATADVAYIVNPRQTVIELLQSICDELGVYYFYEDQGTSYLVDLINEYLLDKHSQGRNTILIIDEAQNLDADVLEQLRLLTNLETNEKKLLQLILLGQPELNDLLARQDLRQLAQRITARYHLQPLTLEEAERYVLHRLTVAGYSGELFQRESIKLIHKASGGIPRLINVICDRCLLGVYSTNARIVDSRVAKQAIAEVQGSKRERKRPAAPRWLLPMLGGATVVVALLAGYFLLPQRTVPVAPSNARSALNAQQEDAARIKHQKEVLVRQLITLKGSSPGNSPDGPVCDDAKINPLECVKSTGSYAEFVALQEPAVIELLQEDGAKEWALLEYTEEDAHFRLTRAGDLPVNQTEETLRKNWSGNYVWVWQAPAGYRTNVSLGEDDDFVKWLRNILPPASQVPTRSDADYPLNRFTYLLTQAKSEDVVPIADIDLLRRVSVAKQRLDSNTQGLTPKFIKALSAEQPERQVSSS